MLSTVAITPIDCSLKQIENPFPSMAMMSSISFHCYSTPKSKFSTVSSSPSHFLTPNKVSYTPSNQITLNGNGGSSRFTGRVSSSSAAEFSTNIGDILSDVTVFTASGQPVLFKDLWDQKQGVAVVAFLRHFGCFCCWELASALKEAKPKFESAGVKLIAVGVGTPDKAYILAERLPFPMDSLYADPERKVFSRLDKVKEAMENYTIKATPDDISSVLQQGGMFVFKGKQLVYARKDEGTGDHAPLDDIFDVCCKTPVG